MQRTLVISAIAFCLSVPLVTAQATEVAFSAPFQLGGRITVTGTWFLLLGTDGQDLELQGNGFAGHEWTEHERAAAGEFRLLGSTGGGWSQDARHTEPQPFPESIALKPSGLGPWSLFVKGTRLALSFPTDDSSIEEWPGGCLDSRAGHGYGINYSARTDLLCAGAGVAQVVRFQDASAVTAISGGEIAGLEWHGMRPACASESCPRGGSSDIQTVKAPNGDSTTIRSDFYDHVTGPASGSLSGRASTTTLIIGGPSLDVEIDGWARLPQASRETACEGCTYLADRTLLLEGDFKLRQVRPKESGFLGAQIEGKVSAVRLDEAAVHVEDVLGLPGAAAVGAAAAAFLLLKFLLAPFFTRLGKDEALEHPRRKQIFDYIRDHPGANFREVARNTGIAAGTVRHHLNVLERAGQVVEHQHGSTVRLFENHGKFESNWSDLVLLREPALGKLHDWLKAHPNSPQKTVLEAMEAQGWSRSTTQHRLSRLVDGGVASIRLQGRLKMYSTIERPSATKPPLPSVLPT